MINVTSAFKHALGEDNRKYLEYADITLSDGTELHLTNQHIWNNGFSVDDAVGDDNSFTPLGSTIINSCALVLNNIYDDFSEYDFTNASVILAIGLELPLPNQENGTYIEKCYKGEFNVDEATYNGSIITIKALDNMEQFDRPYSESTLIYPATLDTIIRDACTICGVELGTTTFPHMDYVIQERPIDEKLTFREVVGWCATIAGCFARFAYYEASNKSKLELRWFNTAAIDQPPDKYDGGTFDNGTPRYTTGDALDGGTFNPWNVGDVADAGSFTDIRAYHMITSIYTPNISVDDVVITGVKAIVKVDSEGTSSTETREFICGTNGYAIEISNNDFINITNAQEIVDWLGTRINGIVFRKANITHSSDPSIEAGDVAIVYDRKGNEYPILITRTTFTMSGAQTTICGAETPNRNTATRYTQATKNFVETRKELKKQKNTYDQAIESLGQAIANAKGMYETQVTEGGATITYLHDKPRLEESTAVIMVSGVGVTVTPNYQATTPIWYGLTVDGTLISSVMNTIGLNFDWGVGGQLTIKDQNNKETLFVDADTGVVRITPTSFALYDGSTIDSIAQSKADTALNSAKTYSDTKVNNMIIGGRNLVLKTAESKSYTGASGYTGYYYLSNYGKNILADNAEKDNVTISFDYKVENNESTSTRVLPYISGYSGHLDSVNFSGNAEGRYVNTKKVSINQSPATNIRVRLADASSTAKLTVSNLKLEYGDKETTWTPAPEDVETEISTLGESLQSQIDGKIQTWYQSADPSTSWTTAALKSAHHGDLWYYTGTTTSTLTNGTTYYYNYNSSSQTGTWVVYSSDTDLTELWDAVDGKSTIFYGTTSGTYANKQTGDYLVDSTDGSTYRWDGSAWIKVTDYASKVSNAITTYDSNLDQTKIFNKLTNNGQTQGIYLQNGKLYLNFAYAVGQTLKLGGINNEDGLIVVYDENDNEIGRIDSDGVSAVGRLILRASREYTSYTPATGKWEQYTQVGDCQIGYINAFYSTIASGSDFGRGKILGLVMKAESDENPDYFDYYRSIGMSTTGTCDTTVVQYSTGRNVIIVPSGVRRDAIDGGGTPWKYMQDYYLYKDIAFNGGFERWLQGYGNYSDVYIRERASSNSYYLELSKVYNPPTFKYNGTEWYIRGTSTVGYIAVQSSSSKRYKHDISYDISNDLNPKKLYDLSLAQFVFNDDHKEIQYADMCGKTLVGFIAEDVDEIYPNAVIHDADGRVESWDERRLLPPMLALIQEQKKQIDEQQEKIEYLEKQIKDLSGNIEMIMQTIGMV